MTALLMSGSRGRGADPVSVVMVTELKGITWIYVGGSGWVIGKGSSPVSGGHWNRLLRAPGAKAA